MQAALRAFAQKSVSGRKFVLLGEMLELGDAGSGAHKAIIEGVSQFDACFLVGAGFAESSDAHAFHCDSADAMLIGRLVDILRPGDSLLIKGSNRVFGATDFVQQLEQALRESKS